MSTVALSDLDHQIYALMAQCRSAQLPVTFCGDELTRKWELVATLSAQLRAANEASANASIVESADGRVVVRDFS